jgi:drug/metabolite transporter (DMT)-like permease
MTGTVWAMMAAVVFGVFQAFNRRAGRGFDAYWSTFILLVISSVILVVVSLFTEDLSLLISSSIWAIVNFGLAGFIHFFLGWTFLTISQSRVGAARTGALIGATPLFAFVLGILAFGEILSIPITVGIALVVGGVYLVTMADQNRVAAGSSSDELPPITLRNSLFGLATAVCFSMSSIFIRNGLKDLDSPLLGVTVGMVVTAIAYGIILVARRKPLHTEAISTDAIVFQLAAGVLVGLATWARWVALDLAPVAVVLGLGRLNVPVVIFLSPLVVGRKQERVTSRVWLGAGLIVAGSLILNFMP